MGFRFQKRINLGGGFGLNVSKSGIRPSVRTKSGTIGTKGFTVRTGIPGVGYKKSYGKSGCLVILILLLCLPIAVMLLTKTSN